MQSHLIDHKCLTKRTRTLIANIVCTKVDLCECLLQHEEIHDVTRIGKKMQSHLINLQCLTKTTCCFCTHMVPRKVDLCECLLQHEEIHDRTTMRRRCNLT